MPRPLLQDLLRFLRRTGPLADGAHLADGALLEQFVSARDDAAFEMLMQRHGPMVLAVCRRICGDAHAAEDAFQATFLVLARRAASIRKQASIGSWLHGVAQRIACRAKAQQATRRDRERRAAVMPERERLDELTWQELREVLDEEITRLPDKYRAAVVLCYLEGKSQTQAAEELGLPTRTLSSRLERACELLRGQLTRRGVALSAGALAAAMAEKASAAPLAASLAINTAKAAGLLAVGKSVGNIVSAQALTLAEEAMKGMIGITGKLALLVVALGLAVGAGFAGYGAWVEQTPPKVDEKAAQVGQDQPPKKRTANPAVDLHGAPLPEGAVARLGTTHWLHDSSVSFVEFLPNGKELLTFAWDGTLRVWQFPAGKEIRRIATSNGYGRNFALSKNGKWFAAATRDGTEIHLYDVETAKQRAVVKWDQPQPDGKARIGNLSRLAFSPHGEHLAALGRDGAVSIWDWAKGKKIHTFATSKGLFGYGVAFAPDGKSIFTINTDNSGLGVGSAFQKHSYVGKLWDATTGKEVKQLFALDGQKQTTDAICFSPDGKTIAIQTDRSTMLVSTSGGGDIRYLPNATDQRGVTSSNIFGLVFAKDSAKFYLYRGMPNVVVEFDVASGKVNRLLKQPPSTGSASVALSPAGDKLVVTAGNRIRRLDLSAKNITILDDDSFALSFVRYTADGKYVLTGSLREAAVTPGVPPTQKWDAATGKSLGSFDPPAVAGFPTMYSPDSNILASRVPTNDEKIDKLVLLNVATGKEIGQLTVQGTENVRGPGQRVAVQFSPDGKSFAVVQPAKGTIEIYSVAPTKLLRTFDGIPAIQKGRTPFRFSSTHIFFSPDSKTLACYVTGGLPPEPSTMIFYETKSGKQIGTLPLPVVGFPFSSASEFAFSPDGRCVVGVPGDGTGAFHELATGKSRNTFGKGVASFAFSPDGRSVLYSTGGSVRLWDIQTGKEMADFKGHTGAVTAVTFSPLGNSVASVSTDGTGLIWDISKVKRPVLPAMELKGADLDNHWQTLAETDAAKAWAAMRDFIAAPSNTVPFLKARLKPAAPPDGKHVATLIRQLDDRQFKTRDVALAELLKIGDLVLPALDKALAANPPLETKRRLEELRGKLTDMRLEGERLRAYRAVEVLERTGTPDARQLLQTLAAGAPGALLTTSSQAALKR